MRLSGKVALITGAGRGIGKEIALKFHAEGACVILNDVEGPLAEAVVDRMAAPEKTALAMQADVADLPQVKVMVERIWDEFGRLDILVNNAGIRRDAPFEDMSETDWDAVLAVVLKGAFHCSRAIVPRMIEQRSGKIINISSPVPAALGRPGQANYSTAACGLEGLTRALALELGPYNIHVNCIAPDYIYTEMTRAAALRDGFYYQDLQRFVVADIPLKRLGTPADVAHAALFFAGEESDFISGQILHVRGGP